MCNAGSQSLGQTNFPALAKANGKLNNNSKSGVRKGKGQIVMYTDSSVISTDPSIFDTNNSVPDTHQLAPTNGSETVV